MHSDHRVSPAVSPTVERPNNRLSPSEAQADPTAWPSSVTYPETPAEQIRNALQILGGARKYGSSQWIVNHPDAEPIAFAALSLEEFAALSRLVTAALFELETEPAALLPPRFEITPAGRAELEQFEFHAVDCGFRGCPVCTELKTLGHELSPVGHVLPQGVRPAFLERAR